MNNLEDFINKNRSEFDSETPDLKIWAAIDKQMSPPKTEPIRRRFNPWKMGIAASMLLLLGLGMGYFFSPNHSSKEALASANLPVEFREAESFYQAEYQNKRQQLVNYTVEPTLEADLEEFDQIILEMKSELKNVPKGNRERVLSAIIQNYQTKIDILQRILDQLESAKTTKSDRNETNI